jgi:hypothetical protein
MLIIDEAKREDVSAVEQWVLMLQNTAITTEGEKCEWE